MTTRASFNRILKQTRLKARRVLKIEQVWAELRWSLLIVFLWGLASLFHIPQLLPDPLHALIELSAFLSCILLFCLQHRRAVSPSPEELDRMIERSTLLRGRPLAGLNDSPVAPQQTLTSQTHLHIWHEYQKRLAASLKSLKVRKPRFFYNWYERSAFLVLIGLYAVGLTLAGPHSLLRLKAGFLPGMDDDRVPFASVQAWIEPPAFTKNQIIFLQNQPHKIDAPILEGSHFFALITGGRGKPHLSGLTKLNYQRLEDKNWKIEGLIHNRKTIRLSIRGREIAFWNLTIEKDEPPFINWKDEPKNLKNSWQTLISWVAHQPQGLKSLELVLTQSGQHPLPGFQPRVRHISLPLNGQPKSNEGYVSLDLSADPFAGGKSEAYLQATSLSGLTSKSPTQTFHLVSRPFHDPLSRALIDLRKRISLHEEGQSQSLDELILLSQLPMTRDVRAAFTQALIKEKEALSTSYLSEFLWYLALYEEDRSSSGYAVALSMAEFRAAQQDVLHKINQMEGKEPFSVPEQEALHTRLERLRKALDDRLKLMFVQASQTGIVLPFPSDRNTPWQKLTHKIQREVMHNQTAKARNDLAELSDMAEQMRQAQKPDLQSLALNMKAQQEARDQRSALRSIIKDETKLLDNTHHRQTTQIFGLNNSSQDVTQISTSALLRQLGINAPDTLDNNAEPSVPDLKMTQNFSEQRQDDYQKQKAILDLTILLIKRGKDLTQKDNKAFKQASGDMAKALKFIAQRDDVHTALLEQKILQELSQAQKEMKKNQRSTQKKSQGRLGFIPPPQSEKNHGNDQKDQGASEQTLEEDDSNDGDEQSGKPQNKDPLGRSLDKGNESDAHIPDSNNKSKDYRSIERELRRRASDRTRPKAELDYLNRLLKPLSHPDL